MPPSERRVDVGGAPVDLKMDLRNYVYRGRGAARHRASTGPDRNFRTPGGGFAPGARAARRRAAGTLLLHGWTR